MEEILISAGITMLMGVLNLVNERFQDKRVAWYITHLIVIAVSVIAVVLMKVVPPEFITKVLQIAGPAVLFYEALVKRIGPFKKP